MSTLTHSQIWRALDHLAQERGLSVSALARQAGLDPTTFNRSKRITADGRLRWPSTESIAKVLAATNTSAERFFTLFQPSAALHEHIPGFSEDPAPLWGELPEGLPVHAMQRAIPQIGFAQAGNGGFFDDAGFPVGTGWDEVHFPDVEDENAYALEIAGDSMLPVFRDGDVVVVSPAASIRRGDRVVVKTREGEVLAKELARKTARHVELRSLNPAYEDRQIPIDRLEWMARIIWASQ
ncbi:S24 family peptidase [Xanthobacter sp. TB0136]|uniref:S24 family peptidase n=1 Tax=Xanthobacter sp. TB0136 TaxID=3459177 RepID=UPI00403A0206